MSAPALRASSTSSASDSRSGTPAGCPGKRGERFHATPTSKALSVTVICWLDFILRTNLRRFAAPRDYKVLQVGRSPSISLYARVSLAAKRHKAKVCERRGCRLLNARIIAKSFEPVNVAFAAKPGLLALGVLSRRLLNRGSCGIQREFATQHRAKLAVTDEIERLCHFRDILLHEPTNFFQPSGGQHRVRPGMDSIAQRVARRLQTDLHGAPTQQRSARCTMDFGERFLRQQANFNRPNNFLFIRRCDLCGRARVESSKHSVKIAGGVRRRMFSKPVAQFLGPLRQLRQSLQQRAQVQPRANRENGKPSSRLQIGKNDFRAFTVIASRGSFVRVKHIDQVMRNSCAFADSWFGGTNVEAAIQLRRIAGDNLSAEFLRECNSKRRLSGCGGTDDDDQRRVGICGIHRNRICQPRMIRTISTTAASKMLPSTCWRVGFTAGSGSPAGDCIDKWRAIR